jgi:hypothetical protein
LAAVERLKRIAAAARAGEALDADDAIWLSRGLGRYLTAAPAGSRLEDALGLATPPGGSPWWSAQRRAERDARIRELAGTRTGPAYHLTVQRMTSAGKRRPWKARASVMSSAPGGMAREHRSSPLTTRRR